MTSNRPGRVSRELLKRVLEPLGALPGVKCAVLFSPDGFEIASHAADAAASARLAAIGSSLSALGSAISAEAGLSEFDRTMIESRDGTVIITRVEAASMSLVVVAGKATVLGQLLWATKDCCQSVAKVLES